MQLAWLPWKAMLMRMFNMPYASLPQMRLLPVLLLCVISYGIEGPRRLHLEASAGCNRASCIHHAIGQAGHLALLVAECHNSYSRTTAPLTIISREYASCHHRANYCCCAVWRGALLLKLLKSVVPLV